MWKHYINLSGAYVEHDCHFKIDNTCYFANWDLHATSVDARDSCSAFGAHLVSLDNQEAILGAVKVSWSCPMVRPTQYLVALVNRNGASRFDLARTVCTNKIAQRKVMPYHYYCRWWASVKGSTLNISELFLSSKKSVKLEFCNCASILEQKSSKFKADDFFISLTHFFEKKLV